MRQSISRLESTFISAVCFVSACCGTIYQISRVLPAVLFECLKVLVPVLNAFLALNCDELKYTALKLTAS